METGNFHAKSFGRAAGAATIQHGLGTDRPIGFPTCIDLYRRSISMGSSQVLLESLLGVRWFLLAIITRLGSTPSSKAGIPLKIISSWTVRSGNSSLANGKGNGDDQSDQGIQQIGDLIGRYFHNTKT